MPTPAKWQMLRSELVLDNQWARVRRDACRLPNGSTVDDYYYWEGGDFAQVFALTPADEVLLVQQYKHGVREIVTELPAGMVAAGDATPLDTARRELVEETGFNATEWRQLGVLDVSSAKATTRAYAFLALGAHEGALPSPDLTEEIVESCVPVAAILRMIGDGRIRDTNSIAVCHLALRALGRLVER